MFIKYASPVIFFIIHFLFLSGCADGDFALSPACEEAFSYNRNVKVTDSTKIPYMKTCGLSVKRSKCFIDVYSADRTVEQSNVDVIYDELEITDRILTEHKIPYSLIAGTMLGSIRNGGLIPNDDDADIAIHERYEKALMKLAPEFEKAGYKLDAKAFDWVGYKVYKNSANSAGLDIFPMKERDVQGEKMLAYAREGAFEFWPRETLSINALDRLERVTYGHLQVSSVSLEDAIAFLNRAYGKDWYTSTIKLWDHVHGKLGRGKRETLLPTEYYYLKHSSK